MATNSNIRPGYRENILRRSTFRDLRSPGVFAKWPIIGLIMFLVGSLAFGALAYEVKSSASVLLWDSTTVQAFHAAAQNIPSPLVEYLIFGFFLGREVVILMGFGLALYFLHKRF